MIFFCHFDAHHPLKTEGVKVSEFKITDPGGSSRRFLYSSYGHRFVRLYFVLFCSLALFPLFNYEYQRLRTGFTKLTFLDLFCASYEGE
jgi:hypothetical protein